MRLAIRRRHEGHAPERLLVAKQEPAPIRFPPSPALAELYASVVGIAEEFPGVTASRSYGTPAIKVKQKLMARLRSEAEGGLAIRCDEIERQMLLQAAPETFYITDHYAKGRTSMVLINLETVRWEAMRGILEHAWRILATPGLIDEFERREP